MWETICDALHIPVARNFGSKFLECPHSSISGMLVWSTTHSPPPPLTPTKKNIWADLGTLSLSWSGVPPLPPKMKIWADLGTLSWSGLHPPPKMIIWADLGTLSLSLEYTPSKNDNLGRSWHFEFESGVHPPPPKMIIWADLGTSGLSWSGVPPPPSLEF